MISNNKQISIYGGILLFISGIAVFNAMVIGGNYLFSIPAPSPEHMIRTTYVVLSAGLGIVLFSYWTRDMRTHS